MLQDVTTAGLGLGYEGSLTRDTTYFVNMRLNRMQDTGTEQLVAESPRFISEMGVQYLGRRGLFLQPTFLFQGSYYTSANPVRTRVGSFGLLNVRVGKRSGVISEVFVELLKAFDRQYDIFGIDRPGRQLRIGALRRF